MFVYAASIFSSMLSYAVDGKLEGEPLKNVEASYFAQYFHISIYAPAKFSSMVSYAIDENLERI